MTVDVGKLLPVVVAHDKTGVLLIEWATGSGHFFGQ
jgi:hypothetical protein